MVQNNKTLEGLIDTLAITMKQGFDRMDKKFEVIDKRFDIIDQKFDKIDVRLDIIEERLERIEFNGSSHDHRIADLEDKVRKISIKVGLA